MQHVIRTLAAIRFALSTRRDLLLEILALRHQLAVLARSNRRFRPSDRLLWLILRGCGRGGATRWCWFGRPPSIGGTALGSFAAGGAVRDVLDDHASIRRVAISLGAWPRKIGCGARREFTATAQLGVVVSERTVSRYLQERPKRPSQTWRTFLANHLGQFDWHTDSCGHPTCRAMTSSTHRPIRVAQSRPTGCLGRFQGRLRWASFDPTPIFRLPCSIQDSRRTTKGMQWRLGRAPPRTGLFVRGARHGEGRSRPARPGKRQPRRMNRRIAHRDRYTRHANASRLRLSAVTTSVELECADIRILAKHNSTARRALLPIGCGSELFRIVQNPERAAALTH